MNKGKKKGRSVPGGVPGRVPGGPARSGTTIGVGDQHNKRTARRDFRWSMYENERDRAYTRYDRRKGAVDRRTRVGNRHGMARVHA